MLREYQKRIIDDVRNQMIKGLKRILIQSPVGSGKTVLIAYMLDSVTSKGHQSLFLVHRRELIKQACKTFSDFNIDYGVIAPGWEYNPFKKVYIASVKTLSKRLFSRTNPLLLNPTLVAYDEVHHLPALSWKKVFYHFSECYHIGLTATPRRLDGRGLSDFFDSMVHGPKIRWLIQNKFLSDYKIFAPSSIDLSSVQVKMGDYVKSQVIQIMDKPTITGNAVAEYKKLGENKKAVVFCTSVEHSKNIQNEFQMQGISCAHIDARTKPSDRDSLLLDFEKGKINVLTNVDLFGEGFDLPAIEVVIMLRPTKSLTIYLQQIGRALRPYPGKDHAIVLDHASNVQLHGLPCRDFEWSLQGLLHGRTKKQESEILIKTCDQCYAVQKPGEKKCIFCGYEFQIFSRKVDEVDGELIEVTSVLKRENQTNKAKNKTELIQIGKARGYRNPYRWANHIIQIRQKKKLSGLSS